MGSFSILACGSFTGLYAIVFLPYGKVLMKSRLGVVYEDYGFTINCNSLRLIICLLGDTVQKNSDALLKRKEEEYYLN